MGMLAERIANGLRVSGPGLSDAEKADIHKAIARARWVMPKGSLPELVWWLFEEAMDTHKRMPNGHATPLSRWPPIWHTPRERWEAEVQRLADLKISKEEPPLPRFPISDPTAIDRMLVVLGWLRYVRSKNLDR